MPRRSTPGLWAIVGFAARQDRRTSLAVAALGLCTVAARIGLLLATARVVGDVTGGSNGWSAAARRSGTIVAALVVAAQVLPGFLDIATRRLGWALEAALRDRVIAAGSADEAASAGRPRLDVAVPVGAEHFSASRTARGVVGIVTRTMTGAAAGAVLATWRVDAAAALVVTYMMVYRRIRRRGIAAMSVRTDTAHELRRATYFRDLATTPPAAKEVRVFGLASWVKDQFRSHADAAMRDVWAARRRDSRFEIAKTLLPLGLIQLAVIASLGWQAGRGDITLGELVVYIGAVLIVDEGIGSIGSDDVVVANGLPAVLAGLALAEPSATASSSPVLATPAPADRPPEDIRFERVTFRYPGESEDVLAGVDLHIPAGTSLALVGANGAGKTTMVRLLAGLLVPTSGRVTYGSDDVRAIEPAGWRANLAIVFQDFARYPLSLADNVAVGVGNEADVRGALDRAGGGPLAAALNRDVRTILTPEASGGVDLSGGQWQRVALARAMRRVDAGARILVLDEPTASLDVRAEAELHDRLLDVIRGCTTVVVSHRFSTVRRADRIAVLAGGRIIEAGTHDELMSRAGTYARMFSLQADLFRERGSAS